MKVEAILWVLVLVSLALVVVSPKYRKHFLVVFAVAVVTVVAVIIVVRKNEKLIPAASSVPAPQRSKRVDFEQLHIEKLDKDDPEARHRIEVSEIRFDQIRPSAGSEPGTIESIRARLYNDSARFALTDYSYDLVVQDCVAEVCTTVYEQRGRASTTVPANQARDVTIEIRAGESRASPSFKLLGRPKIILSPLDTRAYKATSTP